MMTDHPAGAPVQRLSGITTRAKCLPTALGADDHRGKAAAIDENQALLPSRETVLKCADYRRRQPVVESQAIQVENLDLGQPGGAGP